MNPTTAHLIAFTGLAQAGKSTAAQFFTSKGAKLLSFAAPLKAMLAVLTPETDKAARPHALCGKTVREALQSLGTEWGREKIGQDIWLRAAQRQIADWMNEGLTVVCDDVRFPNEAKLIRDMGGVVIEVNRPGLVRMEHASEAGVGGENIDARLPEVDTPEALHGHLVEACARLGVAVG